MSQSIIISRFDENLDWLKPYKNFEIIIYNKGNKLTNQGFKNILNIDNVGRESHTWLYHIVNNYNSLNDINIFLQGRIDDLGCMAYQDPNDYLKRTKKYGFAVSRFGMLTPYHWKWNVGIEKDLRYKKAWENKEISRSKIGFRKFAKKIFPDIPIIIPTSYGGCFSVKKQLIKQYDLNFYDRLLDNLSHHRNPIEGHYMERLWCYIFTKDDNFNQAIKDVIKTKFEKINLKLFTK
tara:strand:+ start:6337 stop:7041 length:705 start_codon:yes stop_codon:yes gene_type:complete